MSPVTDSTWEKIQSNITLAHIWKLEKILHDMCDLHTGIMENVVAALQNPNPEVVDDVRKLKLRRYGISVIEMADRISVEAGARGLRLSSIIQDKVERLRSLVKVVYHEEVRDSR